MTRSDIRQFHLTCPFCFRGMKALIGDVTPCHGDYLVCPNCWGIGVLRSRTMFRKGWTVARPCWQDRLKIADHKGCRDILRKYEIAQFGDGLSAL